MVIFKFKSRNLKFFVFFVNRVNIFRKLDKSRVRIRM